GAYSVRPTADATVSAPLKWDEIESCDPRDFTLKTMPLRYGAIGDPHRGIDRRACSLAPLLELAARQEREGMADAPWPPHYAKARDEPTRVQPSKSKASVSASAVPPRKRSPARRAS